MVTPETSGPGEQSTGSARWKVPVALLTAVAGTAAVFALTAPDPAPSAETSTVTTVAAPAAPTTTIEFIAQGKPLEFDVASLEGFPMAIMDTEAGELILTQGTTLRQGAVTIQNLVSSDGLSWVPVFI